MKKASKLREMGYGFRWDNVLVERAMEHNGYHLITVKTPRRMLDITITPTGLIRTHEIKPDGKIVLEDWR